MQVQVCRIFQVNLRGEGGHTVDAAFNIGARKELDAMIARMFYTGGLSFNLQKNPYYKKSYTYAASNPISGYNSLRTTLLQREKADVALLEPIRGTWKEKRLFICSDGWTDAQRRPIINFMAVIESGPMSLNFTNTGGEKNKQGIHCIQS